MAEIILEGISKRFGKTDAVIDINLTVPDRTFLALVGPSGCGKSTLLRLIAGLETPDRGALQIDGKDMTAVAPAKRGLSMVFQSYALYPHMSVRNNMAFGLKMAKMPTAEIDKKIANVAVLLKLEEHLEKRPGQLSGGQRQRAAIGRAIVRDPKAFLFDEPLSNLDAGLRVQMRLEISRLQRELATTAIYVTHDQIEAMTMANCIALMNSGRIEQVGAPLELYSHPRNLFVAQFIGSPAMNILPCRRLDNGLEITPLTNTAKEFVQLGARAEYINISSAGILAEVVAAEHLGCDSLFYARLQKLPDSAPIVVRTVPGECPKIGDVVGLQFDTNHCHVFDAAGETISNFQTDFIR